MTTPAKFPYTIAELESEAIALQAMSDDEGKLGKIHALGVYCNCHPNVVFKEQFQKLFGKDLERLKAFWGIRNGQQILAEQIAQEGGVQ